VLEMVGTDKEIRKRWICYLDSKNTKYNIKAHGKGYEIVHQDVSFNEEFKQFLEKKKITHAFGPISDDDTDDEYYDAELEVQEWNDSFKPMKPVDLGNSK